MGNASELERELQQLDNAAAQREREAARRRELRQQIAAEKEIEARVAAETWLRDNGLAIKKLNGQLAALLEDVRKNPNQRDSVAANKVWDLIRERVELAEVIARRFVGIKVPATPTVVPPGRPGVDGATGLSIATPRRHLFPVIVASDSPELRAALYTRAAYEWLRGRGSALPKELRSAAEVEVPEPDLSERVAVQRAESARQQQAAYQAAQI